MDALILFFCVFFLGLWALPEIEVDDEGNEVLDGRNLEKERAEKRQKQDDAIRSLRP